MLVTICKQQATPVLAAFIPGNDAQEHMQPTKPKICIKQMKVGAAGDLIGDVMMSGEAEDTWCERNTYGQETSQTQMQHCKLDSGQVTGSHTLDERPEALGICLRNFIACCAWLNTIRAGGFVVVF